MLSRSITIVVSLIPIRAELDRCKHEFSFPTISADVSVSCKHEMGMVIAIGPKSPLQSKPFTLQYGHLCTNQRRERSIAPTKIVTKHL